MTVTETCPHCGTESTITSWNIAENGLVAHCPRCGKTMMLCSECEARCNWDEASGGCKQQCLESAPVPVGYWNEKPKEFFVWEPEDWSPAEWAVLCKVCRLPADRTERIVLHASAIEYYIKKEDLKK